MSCRGVTTALRSYSLLTHSGHPCTPRTGSQTLGPFSGTSMVRKNTRQANNKMQLTRSGHSRWRLSQLILVFYAPREDRARELVGSKSPLPYQTHDRGGSSQRGARPRDLKGLVTRRHRIRPGVSRRLQPGAKRRATPPLSPNQQARPAARLALEHEARCARTVERHRDRLEARSCSGRDVRRQATATTWARMVAPCGCGA